MTSEGAPDLPARYEPVRRLGRGGGGEVWAVRDRLGGRALALKLLGADAGEHETAALVREATSLSALEGLGVPRIVAFGSLGDGRRYLVRELVEGQSLERVLASAGGPAWLGALADAAEQLTTLHRTGLLHGDVKPANVVVGPDGRGTLVDLGLATPWREKGVRPSGLTPRYAAPELLGGDVLTVRAEVFALGATLADALAARGDELEPAVKDALGKIAERATMESPAARYPSVDELASAVRAAARVPAPSARALPWPALGLDGATQTLLAEVALLGPGEAIAIEGPDGSGRTTLACRLAWTLGLRGAPIVHVEGAGGTASVAAVVDAGTERAPDAVLVVDDVVDLDDDARAAVARASRRGARIVAVGTRADVAGLVEAEVRALAAPRLEGRLAEELVKGAVPSLPDALVRRVVERADGLPGALRRFVRLAGERPLVSIDEVDAIFDAGSIHGSVHGPGAPPASRAEHLATLDRSLETGRFDDAARALDALGAPEDDEERARFAVAESKVALARGDATRAAAALDAVEAIAPRTASARAWYVARARAATRAGDFPQAQRLAAAIADGGKADALAVEALSCRGVARAFAADEEGARADLERAVELARSLGNDRAMAVAHGSLAIALQRTGHGREAREAYEAALAAAEAAKDAWTVATTRLNLAVLAQGEGDVARALGHLEAAVDMGRRAGALMAVQQALLNLANLDLYLGRYARAEASIQSLVEARSTLGPAARAQLLGLQAELAARTGELSRGAQLYALCAEAYEAVGRPLDGAEARLEGILTRARLPGADATALDLELSGLARSLGPGGFAQHEALASLVSGTTLLLRGDEDGARAAIDRSLAEAERAGLGEWRWRALEARARLAQSQGSHATAKRDTEAALAILEETARKLPRDLREVFWNDPRRRALRESLTGTMPAASAVGGVQLPGAFGAGALGASSITQSVTSGPRAEGDRLARVLEVTRELAREHDMERLLGKVIDHAVALASAERGMVLLHGESGALFVHTARDVRGDEARTSFSRSVAQKVLETGEPVIATSAKDDERLAQAVSVHQLMIQSVACVPIRGAPPVGRPIGALYLETNLKPGVRFKDELPTLAAFADQAAIAIENARLIAENRARAEELAQANRELEAAKDRLAESLGRRTEQLHATRRDLKEARAQLRSHFGYAGLVGTSAAMRRLYALIERVKDTDVPVLITGESGTGKEMVARAIHSAGARAKAPLVGVNCGAIPENLLESELFGHVKGAFTGADRDRKGLFREAEGGTILLDEIGEMPLKMQAGLLRVLQERKVRAVGAVHEESVDTRVVAATNRDLGQMVAEGSFREDLFYRLNVVELRVPALRERVEDIPPLIDHFLTIFAARYDRARKTVEREALRRLCAYEWPGNVRQLEHVLLNAWLMGESDEVVLEDLQITQSTVRLSVPPPTSNAPDRTQPRARTQEEFKDGEKERILAALQSCNWNRVQAAKLVGIPRRTFYRRLKDYGIL